MTDSPSSTSLPTPKPLIPPPPVLWSLRVLALVGLGIALFLVGVHVVASLREAQVTGPYCNLLGGFFSCDTVLNSEWATWFGIPVPVFGVGAYAVALAFFFAPVKTFGPNQLFRWWAGLWTICLVIGGAAVWFMYLQFSVLERGCPWCMGEHLVGILMLVLVTLNAFSVGAIQGQRAIGSIGIGLGLLAILIIGQQIDTHNYVDDIDTLTRAVTSGGPIDETKGGTTGQSVAFFDGQLKLDSGKHLLIGGRNAKNVVIEAVDYTCPRCRRFSKLVEDARPMLGFDYSFMVLTVPLSHRCNLYYAHDYEETGLQHQHACELAILAHAVWMAEPGKFADFHHWLFNHQDDLLKGTEPAVEMAGRLVGHTRLQEILSQGHAVKLLERDIEIAEALDVRAMPGVFANERRLKLLPEAADTLAITLIRLFSDEANTLNIPE